MAGSPASPVAAVNVSSTTDATLLLRILEPARARRVSLPSSILITTTFTAAVPTSMPAAVVMASRRRPPREERRAERSRVDAVRRDVDPALAVVLRHERLQGADRGAVFRDASRERELVLDPARTGEQAHRPQDHGAVQPGQDVLPLLAEREPLAQLGTREDRARRRDADGPAAREGERRELVQPHVHLVGDVPEVAAAAGRAPIVHLEARHDARRVHLDRLRVLAADVQDRTRLRKERVRPEPVAEDLRSDLLLRKRQPRTAVAGPDAAGDIQRHARRAFDAGADLGRVPHPMEGFADVLVESELDRLVLDLHDALVIQPGEQLERESVALRDLLTDPRQGRARRVAEEVGALGGAVRREPFLFLGDEPLED